PVASQDALAQVLHERPIQGAVRDSALVREIHLPVVLREVAEGVEDAPRGEGLRERLLRVVEVAIELVLNALLQRPGHYPANAGLPEVPALLEELQVVLAQQGVAQGVPHE